MNNILPKSVQELIDNYKTFIQEEYNTKYKIYLTTPPNSTKHIESMGGTQCL